MAFGVRDREKEIAEFLADQQAGLERLNKKEEARIIQESKAAEAEVRENVEKENIQLARSQQFLKAKLAIRYRDDLAFEICRRVAGGEVLAGICEDQLMPTMDMVQDWLENDKLPMFQRMYLKACKRRAAVFEDQLILISDDSSNDYMDKLNSKTGETFRVLDPESLNRSKLRIEMRSKILKAYDPVKWGENASAAVAAAKQGVVSQRPNVVFHFHEAPKMPVHPGDKAKVINHEQPATRIATLNNTKEKVA
jgi:hypothetical protein